MEDRKNIIPNVMPDAMVEPITDMELIMAKLQHDGKVSKQSSKLPIGENRNKEV